jgi:hypothetical protein
MLYRGEGGAEITAKDADIMIKLRYLVPCCLMFLVVLTSCNSAPSVGLGPAATSSSTTEAQLQAGPVTVSTPSTTSGASTPILLPEDLLTAEEASSMVGRAVSITGVSGGLTDTGELYADYRYDFESGSTALASLYLTQNALIPEAEVKLGHDANWAFEEAKKSLGANAADLPSSGSDGFKWFYTKNNMEVSLLFRDYYILVVFMMDADDAATLALNKTIASHIVDEISLADVSLTGD